MTSETMPGTLRPCALIDTSLPEFGKASGTILLCWQKQFAADRESFCLRLPFHMQLQFVSAVLP